MRPPITRSEALPAPWALAHVSVGNGRSRGQHIGPRCSCVKSALLESREVVDTLRAHGSITARFACVWTPQRPASAAVTAWSGRRGSGPPAQPRRGAAPPPPAYRQSSSPRVSDEAAPETDARARLTGTPGATGRLTQRHGLTGPAPRWHPDGTRRSGAATPPPHGGHPGRPTARSPAAYAEPGGSPSSRSAASSSPWDSSVPIAARRSS